MPKAAEPTIGTCADSPWPKDKFAPCEIYVKFQTGAKIWL